MKIIYNREEAILKKEKIDREVEEKNKEAGKRNKKLRKTLEWIFSPIFIVATAIIILGLFFDFAPDKTKLICLGSLAEFALLVVAVGVYVHYETGYAYHEYPADVRYFMATDKEKVLRVYTEWRNSDKYNLKAEIEKENHIVEAVNISSLKFFVRTDISEEILDLKEDKYFIPYQEK